jgi:hypothetical protein
VRRHCDHPFVLDECIDGLDSLLRAKADLAMDVVNLEDQQTRRLDKGTTGARPLRGAGHRHDD